MRPSTVEVDRDDAVDAWRLYARKHVSPHAEASGRECNAKESCLPQEEPGHVSGVTDQVLARVLNVASPSQVRIVEYTALIGLRY